MSTIMENSNLDDYLYSISIKGLNEQFLQLCKNEDWKKRVLEFKDIRGQSCLHLSAGNGHLEVVKHLLSLGLRIHDVDQVGRNALHISCMNGHVEVVKTLIQSGISLDHQDAVHGNTCLHEAAWKGFSQTVDVLCQNKSNLYLKNKGGFSPLHLCCQNGHNETCRVILRAGCKPNPKNNYGDTPLHTATRYGHAGVARILHSARCNINVQNKNGDTPLHIASAMGRRKLVRILLESGSDQTLLNLQGESPKDIAKRKELKAILDLLNNPPSLTQIDDHLAQSVMDGKEPPKKRHTRRRTVPNWSPYGCHYFPDMTEFPEPKPETIPTTPLSPGEQYYLDLGGNIKKGPASGGYICYCAPFFRNFERKISQDRKEIVRHLNSCQGKLENRLLNLEQRTQDQLSHLSNSMKEGFAQERAECHQRMDRRSARDRLFHKSQCDRRDESLKGNLSSWLDHRVSENGIRDSGDQEDDNEIAVLARGAIRGSKRRRKDLMSELATGSLRRAVSQDDLLEDSPKTEEEEEVAKSTLNITERPNLMMMISYDDDASTYIVRKSKSPALPPRRPPPPPYRLPPNQMPSIKENTPGRLSVLPTRGVWPVSSPLTVSNATTNSEGGDSHNDSGYYTRTGIASSGPSPSLSGSRPESRDQGFGPDFISYSSSSSSGAAQYYKSGDIAPKIIDIQNKLRQTRLRPDLVDSSSALPQGSLV